MVKAVLSLFILLACLPIAYAIGYYADININVDDAGFVAVEGNTNHPDLLVKYSDVYTSKKQSYWLLNITKDDVFSDFVYSLNLPDSASINYIKSSGLFRIENNNGKLVIKGFGENKPFSVIVQYQLDRLAGYDIRTPVIIVIMLAIIFLLSRKILKKGIKKGKRTQKQKKKAKKEMLPYSLSSLTARQKKIMKLLIEKNKPLTQAKIQEELKIPKASVSRNIHSLELRGLVEKEKVGMSNMIKLKKRYSKSH